MAEQKTKETTASVKAFLDSVEDETKRKDSYAIMKLMEKVTGFKPKMWGSSIIGFGSYHYKYDSGHEGDAALVGFSPRKGNIALYVGAQGQQELLKSFGKHKQGKGCVYINKLADVDTKVLEQLTKNIVAYYQKKYPTKQ